MFHIFIFAALILFNCLNAFVNIFFYFILAFVLTLQCKDSMTERQIRMPR